MKFNCDKCGLCCKAVNCKYLNKDNTCSIYETRPIVCNIEEGYKMFFQDKMSKQEFFKLNEYYCSVLKSQEK